MSRATGSTTTIINSDMKSRQQSFALIQTPPRNFLTQIHWVRLSATSLVTTSTTVVTEQNISMALTSFAGYADFTSAFDQYCIYGVSATFLNTTPLNGVVRVYTALDYDSVFAIGVTGIKQFSSYNESQLAGDSSLVRYVRPCLATAVYNAGGASASGIMRAWVDMGEPGVIHYGIRAIYDTTVSVCTAQVSLSAVIGFRNNN
jgi:hypothetical protein